MSITVPLYGFGGSGSSGAACGTLTVTAPAGATVTVSKDGKTMTRVAGDDGVVVFRGLASGTWTLTITDGTQEASKLVEIVTDYETIITFFAATIHITYPAGSVCTATDGVTTLTAPDTSGVWECVVPNAGTWTVKTTDGSRERSESVSITADGQSVELEILYRTYLYRDGTFYNGTELVKTFTYNNDLWSLTYSADRISVWARGQYGSTIGTLYTRFSDIVDLSNAKRVTVKLLAKEDFTIYEVEENRSLFRLRINGGPGYGDNTKVLTYLTEVVANTWYTVSVDVSSVDSGYVHLLISPSGAGNANFDITEVYWE